MSEIVMQTRYGPLWCLAVGPEGCPTYTVHASLVGTGFGTSKAIPREQWDNAEYREMHALSIAEEIDHMRGRMLDFAREETAGRSPVQWAPRRRA
jgi:hypothetical protein